ncbi:MAG TPA: iron-sulfur cluster repair di-iron protein [Terriglobales bacterium]|nr:iron-sulfur cluster repair di-iron protein [Terriglobales bacterium]
MYDVSKTVREFALEVPQATRVFEKLGIDYCCGGGKTLSDACDQAKIPVDEVLRRLSERGAQPAGDANWTQATLSDLIDHIVTRHHGYVKQELPRLEQLLNKVATKHGERHPELNEIKPIFARLSDELTSHMMKEENILFPYIKQLEGSATDSGRVRAPMFGTVRNPIHMMEIEHDSAGDCLAEMRELSSGYQAPEEGCFSYKTLYQALADFELDLHQHIHLENNILFPRAIAIEAGQ